MTCFGHTLHVRGNLAILADNGLLGFGWRFGSCWVFQVVIQLEDWVCGCSWHMGNGAGVV